MSSEAAIVVEHVGKCYHIYERPRDRLLQMMARGRKRFFREFWAVNGVSFEIGKGETVGILGRNGSGKSTLLQMICGTLNPTMGNITANGRIAALLELGSGFNPEFTGRENVFMYGNLLGMSRQEIADRYSAIAEFADIGDFIDQPVKTYSSGMMVRLAFAVQVQVDPDILIVDEALAVGDAGFQLKCMLRMRELQARGVTILFVSHDTGSIIRLCDRAILLDHGQLLIDSDDPLAVVKQYETLTRAGVAPVAAPLHAVPQVSVNYQSELQGISETRLGTREAEYLSVDFLGDDGHPRQVFHAGDAVDIRATIHSHKSFSRVVSGFTLKNKAGVDVWGDNNLYAGIDLALSPGIQTLSYRFLLNVPAGEYFLYIGLADISESRIELDQRWPIRKITVVSKRQVLGYVYSPANIELKPVAPV
ncbi:ABC transporter ATP-binding protein [Amantichitinum ursilacus]|uniref:Teichoic acids export ATP-binding protein TagH n=1 Tax=Amantichitinum ursilacus TaxID=857265 RepID=A0A0N1JS32_9NEIS|nr:ABC transporter ATP-binding protein [Amantichitinum ursilacus]KPC50102.1 Teichoic acids export ATP-binding protein TagH [Amantichitinum ursilacus]